MERERLWLASGPWSFAASWHVFDSFFDFVLGSEIAETRTVPEGAVRAASDGTSTLPPGAWSQAMFRRGEVPSLSSFPDDVQEPHDEAPRPVGTDISPRNAVRVSTRSELWVRGQVCQAIPCRARRPATAVEPVLVADTWQRRAAGRTA